MTFDVIIKSCSSHHVSSSLANEDSSSGASILKRRGEAAQLDAGVGGRKLPIDAPGLVIAPVCPGADLLAHRRPVGASLAQARPLRDAEFEVGHVAPRAVLGRVVDLEAVRQALGVGGG